MIALGGNCPTGVMVLVVLVVNSLSLDTIDLPDIYTFKARLKRLNPVYLDLLKKV